MSKKIEVELPFEYRDYQLDFLQEFEHGDTRQFMLVWPRRSGKDVLALNAAIRYALRNTCIVFYVWPTYKHGKSAFFESMTMDGLRFIDFIPKELIVSINSVDLTIKLINNSLIRVVGSNKPDSLRGSNPTITIFSEWAWCAKEAWSTLSPVYLANPKSKFIFVSTPNGKNHMYDQWMMASQNPKWYSQLLTVDDTKHIDPAAIEEDRIAQNKSHDWVLQEYYCSFDFGSEGTFYGKYIDKLRLNDQIGDVPWRPDHRVWTFWDIGLDDYTCVVFAQLINNNIHIIDCILDKDKGLDYYAREVLKKQYHYAGHIGPHDLAVREWANGAISRLETARDLGIDFTICPRESIEEGIESVRFNIPRMFIDERKAKDVIRGLENYRKQFDQSNNRYLSVPVKDWTTDVADAVRYMCVSLPVISTGMTEQDAQDLYNKALYGGRKDIRSPYEQPMPGMYGQFPHI